MHESMSRWVIGWGTQQCQVSLRTTRELCVDLLSHRHSSPMKMIRFLHRSQRFREYSALLSQLLFSETFVAVLLCLPVHLPHFPFVGFLAAAVALGICNKGRRCSWSKTGRVHPFLVPRAFLVPLHEWQAVLLYALPRACDKYYTTVHYGSPLYTKSEAQTLTKNYDAVLSITRRRGITSWDEKVQIWRCALVGRGIVVGVEALVALWKTYEYHWTQDYIRMSYFGDNWCYIT